MNATAIASNSAGRFRLPWHATFVLLSAIWGCSFWWIKLGLEMLAPVQVAFVRLAVGAAALAIVAFLTGTRVPRSLSTWRHLLVVALLMNSIPFTLFAVGETHISSILAGIINAMTPLTTLAVILLAFPEEHPTAERVVGLLVGAPWRCCRWQWQRGRCRDRWPPGRSRPCSGWERSAPASLSP
jgi:drug/metabolite transporter (DMT)-like permease